MTLILPANESLHQSRHGTLALIQVGDAEPARDLGQDTLRRCRRAFGPDHPITQYLTEAAGISHPMPGGDAAADGPSRSS